MAQKSPPAPVAFSLPLVPRATGNAHEVRRKGPRCKACKQPKHASVGRKDWATKLKRAIMLYSQAWSPRSPWDGPVDLAVTFFLPIPDGWPIWKHEAAEAGYVLPLSSTSGDRDNLHKVLADGLEAAGFYTNDSIVTDGPIAKRYSAKPRYEVVVRFLPHGPSSAKEWAAIKLALQSETCDAIEPLVTEDDTRL